MADNDKPAAAAPAKHEPAPAARAAEVEAPIAESSGDELHEAIKTQNELEDAKSNTSELVEGGKDAVKREIPDVAQNGVVYAGTDPEFKRANPEDV